jgi:cation:H+ antiporter
MEIAEVLVALPVILLGAEIFTNGVEWVGESFGLSEGAVGSVLAAVGTALPETVLPLVAILIGGSGKEIGEGAILGAPLMLTTLAMFVFGLTVLLYARSGRRAVEVQAAQGVLRQDLAAFLAFFALAVVAGLVRVRAVNWVLAAGLVVAYFFYVRRHFMTPDEKRLEAEAAGALEPLYITRVVRGLRPRESEEPPPWVAIAQTVIGLGVIVGGARLFVMGVDSLADRFNVAPLAFSLLVAPVATELPEVFNASVIWARRSKDTLALGNITGATVFQAVFPVVIGLLLTPWRLSGDGLAAALVALGAGVLLYGVLLARGGFTARFLLIQGAFYAGFVTYVVVRLN